MYRSLVRPLLFSLSPRAAHGVGMAALAPLEYVAPLRWMAKALFAVRDPRLETHLLGLDFPTPIGLAGGFDKNAARPHALASLGFGFLELGTVTAEPQTENPPPNLFRLPEDRALINRLGFPNAGAKAVIDHFLRRGGPDAVGVPVAISIGKSRVVDIDPVEPAVADYLASFREAKRAAHFVIVNVSSPNTKNLRALQGSEVARRLFGALVEENEKAARRVPLLVKIAPDMSDEDLDALLEVVREVRLDGVVATNTTVRRDGLRTDAAVVASIGQGGLSGPPLRLRSREVVTRARQKLGPVAAIIGVGGVETGDDARALLAAGANLVQLYTGFVYGGPGTPGAIARGLIGILEREKKAHVGEFVSAIVGEAASLARAARHGPPANEARSSGSAAEP